MTPWLCFAPVIWFYKLTLSAELIMTINLLYCKLNPPLYAANGPGKILTSTSLNSYWLDIIWEENKKHMLW